MQPIHFKSIDETCAWALKEISGPMVMATPLGLGKPNLLINAIYQGIKSDPKRELRIFTALSLDSPSATSLLERRFFEPFRERQWGAEYPVLDYIRDLQQGGLPPNIRVHEFYMQAGKALNWSQMQRDYVSVNYTHVPYTILDYGVNILVQMVARKPGRPGFYSLACNPDLSLDVVDLYRHSKRKLIVIGMVHPDLPYCGADAEVPESFFSAVVESLEVKHQIFALPRSPIAPVDYMIGLQSSLLIEDGGTLQIGIGSLSDALVHCMLLRQKNNALYCEIRAKLLESRPVARRREVFHSGRFQEGLYGTSEMVMDGFMHLHRAGILKREVTDLDKNVRRYLHGAFFLGSKEFYSWLRELDRAGDTGLCMTRVSKVNDLYDSHELALRRQRVKARFFNTCMDVTLLGGAASDTKENGQVVSGVGGQFNFVAMSHELPDSMSVLMFRALHGHDRSNVQWGHGQMTIPRHMRDTVISEYGIGFLKNRSDEEVIQAVLCVADARFQEPLRQQAVRFGKLDPAWRPPPWTAQNTPALAADFLKPWRHEFPQFPFGSDFTPIEEQLAFALNRLKYASKAKLAKFAWYGLRSPAGPFQEALERMQLSRPKGFAERIYRAVLLGSLSV